MIRFLFQIGAIKTEVDSGTSKSGVHVSIPDWCD